MWVFSWGCFIGIPVIKTRCSLGALMWPAAWAEPSLFSPAPLGSARLGSAPRGVWPWSPEGHLPRAPLTRSVCQAPRPLTSAVHSRGGTCCHLADRWPCARWPSRLPWESKPLADRQRKHRQESQPLAKLQLVTSLNKQKAGEKAGLEAGGMFSLRLQRAHRHLAVQISSFPPLPSSAGLPPTPGNSLPRKKLVPFPDRAVLNVKKFFLC